MFFLNEYCNKQGKKFKQQEYIYIIVIYKNDQKCADVGCNYSTCSNQQQLHFKQFSTNSRVGHNHQPQKEKKLQKMPMIVISN